MSRQFKNPEMLEKINRGDKTAFLELYNYYAPKMFRHIYYRLNSKEAAEDLAQQVFYKVWQYIATQDKAIDNLNAFIYQTAHNLIVDFCRRSERKNISLDNVPEKKFAAEASYIVETDKNIQLFKIKGALEILSQEQRQLIIWRYLDDLPISQIARLANKPKNAVYVALHRALKALKGNLIL